MRRFNDRVLSVEDCGRADASLPVEEAIATTISLNERDAERPEDAFPRGAWEREKRQGFEQPRSEQPRSHGPPWERTFWTLCVAVQTGR